MKPVQRRVGSCVVALVTWLGAGVAGAQPAIEVEAAGASDLSRGDGNHAAPMLCPSAESIRAAVRALRPDLDQPTSQTVKVRLEGETILLTLSDGGPGSMRLLPAAGDCATRADAVALVIAAWSGGLPAQPTQAPLQPTTDPVSTASAFVPAPVSRPRHAFEVDAAGFQSLVWGHASGAWLGVGFFPRGGLLGVRVFGAWQGASDLAIGAGNNRLSRSLGGAAATLHMKWRAWFGSMDLGLAMTYTHARGEGYASNTDASVWNWGGLADLRTGLAWGRTRVWANARMVRLAHEEEVSITGEGALPHESSLRIWDAQLGLGLGMRFE
jgi:hypothetical protein